MEKTRVCRWNIGVRVAIFQCLGKWTDGADSRQRTRWNVLHESNFRPWPSHHENALSASHILDVDTCLWPSGCGQVTDHTDVSLITQQVAWNGKTFDRTRDCVAT